MSRENAVDVRVLERLPEPFHVSGPLTVAQLGLLQASLIYGTRSEILAEKLGLSRHTIDTHFRHIRRRLGRVSRGEAILVAVRNGWMMSTGSLLESLEVPGFGEL